MLAIAAPRPRDAAATRAGVCQCVVASTIARARAGGSSDLKMPEPTNTPSAPSCITAPRRPAWRCRRRRTGRPAGDRRRRPARHELERGAELLGRSRQLGGVEHRQAADLAGDRAQVAHRLDDVAGAGLALGADHRGALADSPQRLAEVRRAADERHLERPLVDVVGLVGRRQHLGLVDVVDLERLEHAAPPRSARCAPSPSPGSTRLLDARIIAGSDMRATPPSRRMSAGTRSSAITAAAPASSAIRACSGVTTSMITPPLSSSARPDLTRRCLVAHQPSISSYASARRRRERAVHRSHRACTGRRSRTCAASTRRKRRATSAGTP